MEHNACLTLDTVLLGGALPMPLSAPLHGVSMETITFDLEYLWDTIYKK